MREEGNRTHRVENVEQMGEKGFWSFAPWPPHVPPHPYSSCQGPGRIAVLFPLTFLPLTCFLACDPKIREKLPQDGCATICNIFSETWGIHSQYHPKFLPLQGLQCLRHQKSVWTSLFLHCLCLSEMARGFDDHSVDLKDSAVMVVEHMMLDYIFLCWTTHSN